MDLPLFNTGTSVGLYLDDKTVYVAELQVQFGNVKVLHTAQADLPASPAIDNQSISTTISTALVRAGIQSKDVFTALAKKDSIVRYFEMPLLPRGERQDAARFEAQKYVPFNMQELYCDCGIQIDHPQKKTKVMLLAARKKAVDHMMTLMQNAGLKVRSLESDSLSLARVFTAGGAKGADKETCAVIDINQGLVRISVVKDNILLMTHQDALADTGLPSCVAAIRLLFNYFTKNHRSEKISRVVLYTDNENDFRGLDKLLEAESGMSVETFNPVEHYGNGRAYSLGMLTAIGLGLKGVLRNNNVRLSLAPKKKFNLLEEGRVLSPVEEKDFLFKAALMESAALLLIILLIYGFLSARVSSLKMASVKAQPGTVSALMDLPEDQLKAQSDGLAKKAGFLTRLIGKRIFLTSKMNAIAKIIPANMRLTALDYADKEDKDGSGAVSLRIEGTVLSGQTGLEWPAVNQLVLAFVRDKEFMRGFKDVKIASVLNVAEKNTRATKFIIDCSAPDKVKI